VKRHNRLATAGVVHKMQADGLVVAKPRIYAPKFPWVGLVMLVASVFMFKGYLHHALGADDFAARSEGLAQDRIIIATSRAAAAVRPTSSSSRAVSLDRTLRVLRWSFQLWNAPSVRTRDVVKMPAAEAATGRCVSKAAIALFLMRSCTAACIEISCN